MIKYFKILVQFIYEHIIVLSFFALYVLLTSAFHIENCIIQLLIGYPCPGCGMSRAVLALLQFDFISAWHYQPVVFILPILGFVIIFKEIPWVNKMYQNNVLWIVVLVLISVTYILRMILVYPHSPMEYNEQNLFQLIVRLFNKN